jgi:hypothetical protein
MSGASPLSPAFNEACSGGVGLDPGQHADLATLLA